MHRECSKISKTGMEMEVQCIENAVKLERDGDGSSMHRECSKTRTGWRWKFNA